MLGLVYLNARLYYQPKFQNCNVDVYHQLQFLKTQLQEGAGEEMQQLFPEGFLFIHALYGLAWCDFLQKIDHQKPMYKEGVAEIDKAIQAMNKPMARRIFAKEQTLPYGAFYNGWTTYLLAKKLELQATSERDSLEMNAFQAKCETMAAAIRKSPTPYLTSYPYQAWPADMLLVVASLKKHDAIFEPKYEPLISTWLQAVKLRLDTSTQLIPHEVHYKDGMPLAGARGSSQSLMLNFLYEIDADFSKSQFSLYKKYFLARRFGLPGVREYPKGVRGTGDIDSGPVLLGIGGAASIVGQRTMGVHGEWEQFEGLRNCIEAFGAACTVSSKKRYIFGQLPMADAFIAWSNALENHSNQYITRSNWRWRFQLLSLAISLLSIFVLARMRYKSEEKISKLKIT